MGKVRARRSISSRAPYGMASRALLGHERLLTGTRFGVRRRNRVLLLQARPFIESALFFRDDKERHVGMLQPAEFRALAAIDASALGADGKFIRSSRHEILLAGKARHPEGVNDVETFELQTNLAPDRDVNFVRGLETLFRRRTEIFDSPPPLQATHLDRQVIVAGHAERARGEKA